GRELDPAADREAQPVSLAVVVVRILAEQQHPDLIVGRVLEGGEHLLGRREHLMLLALVLDEAPELEKVGFVELGAEHRLPAGRQVGECGHSPRSSRRMLASRNEAMVACSSQVYSNPVAATNAELSTTTGCSRWVSAPGGRRGSPKRPRKRGSSLVGSGKGVRPVALHRTESGIGGGPATLKTP